MGESDRYSDYQRPRKRFTLGDDNNAVVALVTINIVFFLLLKVIGVIYDAFQTDKFSTQVLAYFQLPANLTKLIGRPWTVLTYMFTEVNVLPMLGSMLWLWAFGFILQELTGNKKLIPLYIYGGVFGAVFFIVSNYLISASPTFININPVLMGSSSSTMAIAVATTMLAPDYRFFRNIGNGIPIWIFTLVYVLIDFAGVANSGAPYSIAHLGGGVAGLLFVYLLRKGYDTSIWMNQVYNWFMNLFNPGKKNPQVNIREKVFYNSDNRKPFKKTSNVTQQRVDEILDKINQKGFHFLTDEEKNILKRAADEDLK